MKADGPHHRETLQTLSLVACFDAASAGLVALLLDALFRPVTAGLAGAVGLSGPLPRLLPLVLLLTLVVGGLQARSVRTGTLSSLGANRVDPADRPGLHRRLTRLATGLDVPVPALAVADHEAPNSLTVGVRDPTVVLTSGLLETLEADELDAVLAHELAHQTNRDASVLTLASAVPKLVAGDVKHGWLTGPPKLLAGALLLIAGYLTAGSYLAAPFGSAAYTLAFLGSLFVVLLVGGALLGALALGVVLAGRRLIRTRVFAADRAAARLTGSPATLARALAKLDANEGSSLPLPAGAGGLCFLPNGLPEDATLSLRAHPTARERVAELGGLTAAFEREGGEAVTERSRA